MIGSAFPTEGLNIDQVVICREGVCAVATEGYTKLIGDKGKSTMSALPARRCLD